jgi:hypothetical protein
MGLERVRSCPFLDYTSLLGVIERALRTRTLRADVELGFETVPKTLLDGVKLIFACHSLPVYYSDTLRHAREGRRRRLYVILVVKALS